MKKNFFNWNVDDESFTGFNSDRILEITEVVAQIFKNDFGINVEDKNVTIFNNAKSEIPIAYRNTDMICLAVKGNYPMQAIYQLAHEILHYFLFDKTLNVPAQIRWLEETLCELSSILTIYVVMRTSFEAHRLFADITNNKAAQDYLDCILNKNKRFNERVKLLPNIIYERKKETLAQNPYRRRLNSVFAVEIFFHIKNAPIKGFWQGARKFVKIYDTDKSFLSNLRLTTQQDFIYPMRRIFEAEPSEMANNFDLI